MTKDQRASRRKKHRNSKLGCPTCKRRRVKCLETLPECTNCEKHGSRCEYLDYTEKQLSEFKKAKQEYESRDSQSLLYPEVPNASSASYKGDTVFHSQISPLENTYDSPLAAGPVGLSASVDMQYSAVSSTTEPPQYDSGWSSRDLTSQVYSSGVTQNFDNLLTEQGHEIVYPVYSFCNSPDPQWSYNSQSMLPDMQQDNEIILNNNSNLAGFDHCASDTTSLHHPGKMLPHGEQSFMRFDILSPEDMDFDARLHLFIINLGPLISQGKADLQQIRELYHAWLGHFIYKAYTLSIMFLCLTNLTTNYLITNVFRSCRALTQGPDKQKMQLRKTLLSYLIQHYAAVIKSLRSLLNKNSDPQLASSLSYILSIMSIYDPEATLDSTVCFRDGMFSVLSYTLQFCKNMGVAPPLFVPVHMQLAANIVRTVYLPAYNPSFLGEYELMLRRLGVAISSIKSSEIRNHQTFEFIVSVYEDLWKFCQDSIRAHIPAVNNNLADIPFQLDVLFNMFRKWANLGPSRLLTVSRSTDPLEKVLNLFFRLFRKAVYAVVPQVKFCFLRDFDSPLMLDVFPNSCDASVLYSLDDPDKLCLAPEAYARILNELKLLSAYAIRVNTFLNIRISILYKNLVYNEKVRRLYPIDNIVDWKNSISDIHATRKEFQDRIGLQEHCIENFNSTYICTSHYPRMLEPGAPEQTDDVNPIQTSVVDLLSLQPNGLLKGAHFALVV
ncbi:hypothetical protein METBIDRAFT_72615 [Metschnikowia bicuspidata var. bicuspidata NRRL YB-4993]|uniref:Zn(2)-C6 fungal-type domain-containing protein n=1 Tax=Metschnikowia bicuspidata var. bicuspidata NRRL YB-4993 TaxID=869754 RepID=A0A1A0H7M3_9ASCO|nr:hypothetical protein METBIDRAFT_72615 [Metschnikowia bicuspidata var. bicuspidata NRRL YB-4993]OBA19892.1 hypothetical protein METBIDRAFT_72615 [Metschnikowia bicuspidata var. bicuspidata NRRL YB-4993]